MIIVHKYNIFAIHSLLGMPPRRKRKQPASGVPKRGAKRGGANTTSAKPIDRLYPSKIICESKMAEKMTGATLLTHYLLTTETGSVQRWVEPEDVAATVCLPMLAQGTFEDLKKTDRKHWDYQQEGIIRIPVATAEFKSKFVKEGFDVATPLITVPILDDDQQESYLKDPDAFVRLMKTSEWLNADGQRFWIVDGANRYTLCKENNIGLQMMILSPTIGYLDAQTIALTRNEGSGHVHNETSPLAKAIKCGTMAADGYTQGTISKYFATWGGESRVSQFCQVYKAIILTPTIKELCERPV